MILPSYMWSLKGSHGAPFAKPPSPEPSFIANATSEMEEVPHDFVESRSTAHQIANLRPKTLRYPHTPSYGKPHYEKPFKKKKPKLQTATLLLKNYETCMAVIWIKSQGPFLVPLKMRCRNIFNNPKAPVIKF